MSDRIGGYKALVTGADGFIGSHLVETLVAAGADVHALVCYNSWNQIGWLSHLPRPARTSIKIVSGDVRDPDRVRAAVEGCHYVFHLSSLVGIPYSYEAPRSYVETNVLGTLHVLQAARACGSVRRLVQVSTSEVYGTAQRVPIDENHPLVAQSPYAASKIAADKLAESFQHAFGLPVVVARPFNTFGPRQTARAIIPTIASQLLSGCRELQLGLLHPTRDFNFVTDTVDAMISLALADGVEGQVFNIGTGKEWSIEHTAKLIMDIVGRDVPIRSKSPRLRPETSEVYRLVADNQKIRTFTQWEPKVTFQEGLGHTVKWIQENLDHFDVDRYAL